MKKFKQFAGLALAALLLAGCSSGQSQTPQMGAGTSSRPAVSSELEHQVKDTSAPKVFFIKRVDPDALVKVYEAMGQPAEGKVGLKLSFESPNGPYLPPSLLKPLRDKVDGTFIDSNGFTPPRNTTEGNLQVAKDHGYADAGPVDVLDAEGEMDLPVQGKHLKFLRTGSHFANYDSIISLTWFKPHHLRDYGGTIKNMTICLSSPSGKALLHSAGRNDHSYSEGTMDEFMESLADGTKAALDAKKDGWVFINVLSAINPDDSCDDAKPQPDIGILASTDPVAVDQAAVDMTFGAAPDSATRDRWEKTHNTGVLEDAEDIGAGKRDYQLIVVE